MKACALTAPRTLSIIERPEPAIREPHEVLLRIESVGVCGSDIHYYVEGRIGSQVVEYPYLVGHECSATVLETGSAVRRVRPGDRVAVEPAIHCGACDQCLAGRPHTCRKLRFLGCPGQIDGCLCERIVMPEACCYPMAPQTAFDQAALAEPLSIGVYAARRARLRPDLQVGVLGAGPIGLCTMLAAKAEGVSSFVVTEPIPERREHAMRAGASWAGNPYETDVIEAVSADVPALLDVVFECSGKQEAFDDGVRLLKPGGMFVLIGIPSVDRIHFSMDLLRRHELTLQNVRRQNGCMQTALDLVEAGKIDIGILQTHIFPFEKTGEAFDLVAAYRDGVMKAMIHVGPDA